MKEVKKLIGIDEILKYFFSRLVKWLKEEGTVNTAKKLEKPIKINGVEFDGTEDINIPFNIGINNDEKSYNTTLEIDTDVIVIPKENILKNYNTTFVFVNGIKIIQGIDYFIDNKTKQLIFKDTYKKGTEIEIIFSGISENNILVGKLPANKNKIGLGKDIIINKNSIIHIYVDGLKLIKNKHYTINTTNNIITIKKEYTEPKDIEIIFIK